MFCNTCGSHLIEGGRFCNTCGTPVEAPATAQPASRTEPVADSFAATAETASPFAGDFNVQQPTAATPDWMQTLQAGAAQAAANSKKIAQEAASSDLAQSLKSLALLLLKNPANGIEAAWQAKDKTPQLILGGIHLLLWLILPCIAIGRTGLNVTTFLLQILGLAVIMVAIKLIHGIAYYLASDKQHDLQAALALTCAGSLQESLCMLLLTLVLLLFGVSHVGMIAVLVLLWVVFGIVSAQHIAMVMVDKHKTFYLVTLVTVMCYIILLLLGKQLVVSTIQSYINNLISSLW